VAERGIVKRGADNSPAGDGAEDDKWFFAGDDGIGQGLIRRFMREVFFASEKAEKRAALKRLVIADGAAQHGEARFEGSEHGRNRDRGRNFEFNVAGDASEVAEMGRKNDANHGKPCSVRLHAASAFW
jgi:hypothetical protein